MKILLLGSTGQVGTELFRSLKLLGTLVTPSRDVCNFDNSNSVRSYVRDLKPQIIVNAAAYTKVDAAQTDAKKAHQVNASAVEALAQEAADLGSVLIHYSTDYVFDGEISQAYKEIDNPHPLNVYGATKLAGEKAIQFYCPQHIILRTSWVMSGQGNNFARTILKKSQQMDLLSVVVDQRGTPTTAEFLADATAQLIGRHCRENQLPWGLYHLTSEGVTTWYEYANHIVDYARYKGLPLKVKSIRPILSSNWPMSTPRPINSQLDCTRFCETFGLTLPNWKDAVNRVLDKALQQWP